MFQKLDIPPGVIREVTQYAAESIGWYDSDKIRFRKGFPEKINGWEKYFAGQLDGIPRSFHIWRLLDGRVVLAIGTEEKVYIFIDDALVDITPIRHFATSLGEDPLEVVYNTDVDASFVTINHTNHHFSAGDPVTIYSAVGFGGLTSAALNRTHDIDAVIDANTYTIKLRPPEDGDGLPIDGLDAEVADEAWVMGGGAASEVTRDIDGESVTHSLLEDSFKTLSGISSGNATYPYNASLVYPSHALDVSDPFTLSNVEGFAGVPSGDFNQAHTVVERISAHEIGFDVDTTPEALSGGGLLVEVSGPTYMDNPAFSTTSGSIELIAHHTGHGATVGASVLFAGAPTIGGVPAAEINTTHTITRIDDANNYAIEVVTPASTTTTGGPDVTVEYQINLPDTGEVDGRLWSFDNWGEDLIMNEWGGSVYRWDASNENEHARIVAGAPRKSQLIKVTDTRHLACFGCSQADDRDSDLDTLHVQWCSQEDLDDWDIISESNSAGDYLITGGSQILSAAKVEGQVLIWTEEAVHGMLNVGPPLIFQFDQVGTSTGIIGPNAWATHNGMTFWMGDSSFYVYHGGVVAVICSVQDFVFSNVDFDNRRKAFAGVDRRNDEITWYYPTTDIEPTKMIADIIDDAATIYVENTAGYPQSGSIVIDGTTIAYTSKTDAAFHGCTGALAAVAQLEVTPVGTTTSGEPCRYATLSIKESVWWIGRLERTAWIDRGAVPHPIAADAYGNIFEHEIGADADGEPLASLAESAEFDIENGDREFFISRLIPDFDFRGAVGASVELCLRTRYWPHSIKISEIVGTVDSTVEKISTRIRGRQASIKIRSFALGDKWRMGANRIDVQPDGKKD